MEKIIIKTYEGKKELAGECLSSKLVSSKNVEKRIPLKTAGQFATKQVPTDQYKEAWHIEGINENVYLTKFVENDKNVSYLADEENEKILEQIKPLLNENGYPEL